MKQSRETRWSRIDVSSDGKFTHFRSKFLDGSASITLAELKEAWPGWNEEERFDFCNAVSCGGDIAEIVEILCFLINQSDRLIRMTIALSVATHLPSEESVPVLKKWCLTDEVGHCANYFQALYETYHPDVLPFLRNCFRRIWVSEGLMAETDFVNQIAFDAVCCLQIMLQLGEDICLCRNAYETLKHHPDAGTREQARRQLSRYFEQRKRN
jgi:hypothetical protein